MSATKKTAPEVGGLQRHRELGHVLMPLRAGNQGELPRDKGWVELSYEHFDAAAHMQSGANVGVQLRSTDLVIDVDPRNMPDGRDTLRELSDAIGVALHDAAEFATVETGGGGWHVYLSKPADLAVVDGLSEYPGIEFKTRGRQTVAAGSVHPDTGRLYAWHKQSMLFEPPLVEASLELLELAGRHEGASGATVAAGVYDPAELAQMLGALNVEDFRDQGDWLQLMQACHHATGGDGREVFLGWSTADPQYADDAQIIGRRWDSLSAAPVGGRAVTHRTLEMLLTKADRTDVIPRVDPADDFDDDFAPSPAALRKNKAGCAKDDIKNALNAVRAAEIRPAFDELKQQVVFKAHNLPWEDGFGRTLNEDTMRLIRHFLIENNAESDYQPSKENVYEAVRTLAYEAKFNPVLDYIDSLRWDGVPRVERLFPDYFKTADDQYTRAVGRCFLVAAVRRQRRPGCKFDTMPILRGRQGCGKSTGVKVLFGEDFFSEATLGDLGGKDAPMLLRGIWVQEMAELEGMRRAETNTLKGFVSRATDRYREPYAKDVSDYPRRCVFFGTTNESGYLKDSTGARRFWPLTVGDGLEVDQAAIHRDRDQLWAEAAALEAKGSAIVLDRDVWELAAERQADETSDDPWAEDIAKILHELREAYDAHDKSVDLLEPRPFDRIHATDLMERLDLAATARSKDARQRIKTIMTDTLGWTHHKNVRINGRQAAGYRAPIGNLLD